MRDVLLPDRLLFGWVGCIIKFSCRRSPFTGAAVARSAKGVETSKLHQKFSLWVGLFDNPHRLKTEFSQKFRLTAPPPPPPPPPP